MGAETSAAHGENISSAVAPRVNSNIPKVTWRSVVMAMFVSMGGLLFGYDTGQISGFEQESNYLRRYGMQKADGTWYLSDVRSGLLTSLLSIGTLIGALVAAPIANRVGRKWSITIWNVILIVGLVVQITAPSGNWVQMVMGRWTTGLGVGACSLLVPMYMGESAPRHIRGAMISTYQLFVTFGILLAYLINLGTNTLTGTAQWRITLGLTFLFALALGGGMALFPESPRFDYRHGRVDRARTTMSKLYGVPENHQVILEELDEIQNQLEAETGSEKWYEFLTAPRMFHRICIGMALQTLQQLTGSNYFFYYVCPRAWIFLFDARLTGPRVPPSSRVLVCPTASLPRSSWVRSTLSRPLVVCTPLRTLVVASP